MLTNTSIKTFSLSSQVQICSSSDFRSGSLFLETNMSYWPGRTNWPCVLSRRARAGYTRLAFKSSYSGLTPATPEEIGLFLAHLTNANSNRPKIITFTAQNTPTSGVASAIRLRKARRSLPVVNLRKMPLILLIVAVLREGLQALCAMAGP